MEDRSNSAAGELEELDLILQALAHPVRRKVIELLAERKRLSYSDLMRLTSVDDSGTFGFHLRRLRGLVEKDENGDYRLTELGHRAYRVLMALRAGGGLGKVEKSNEERRGFEDVVSIEGVPSLEIGEDFLKRLAERGQGLVVRYAERLVIRPLDRELFERVVRSIEYVGTVYAPESLRGSIEPRLRWVAKIRYYSGPVPPPGDTEGLASSIASAVTSFVSHVVSRALSAARIRESFSSGKDLRKGRLSDSITPSSDELVLISDTCAIELKGSEDDKLSYDYSFVALDPGLVVSDTAEALQIRCEPVKAQRARLSIRAPRNWPRELSLSLDTSRLEASGVSANRARFILDTSDANIELLLRGQAPLLELRTDTSRVKSLIKGDWSGEAVVRISADTSNIDLSLETSSGVAVSVEPEYMDTSLVRVRINGENVGTSYRSEGYEKADKKLRIILFADTSNIRIDVETKA